MQDKLTVEIWSDTACPFCYLGKRRFDKALEAFANRDDVEVVWKSFQLNPYLKTDPSIRIYDYLARAKGIDVEAAKQMNDRVSAMAAPDGLVYDFDKVIVANTFDSQRLVQFAKQHGKQDEAEERLFRAYFTEGRNVADRATLIELGQEIGLDAAALSEALESGAFADDVKADIEEAQQLGVNGVPFFVFDRKYAVSGAQETASFARVLEQAFTEWRASHPKLELVTQGEVCDVDGECR